MTSPRTAKPAKPKKNSYIHFWCLKLCRSIPLLWPIQLGWPYFPQIKIFQKEVWQKWQELCPKSDFLLHFSSRSLIHAIFRRNLFSGKRQIVHWKIRFFLSVITVNSSNLFDRGLTSGGKYTVHCGSRLKLAPFLTPWLPVFATWGKMSWSRGGRFLPCCSN